MRLIENQRTYVGEREMVREDLLTRCYKSGGCTDVRWSRSSQIKPSLCTVRSPSAVSLTVFSMSLWHDSEVITIAPISVKIAILLVAPV